MRKGLTKHAVFIVNDVMRLPRKSPITRYMIVIFTFIISGLYHAALTPQIPWHCSMLQLPYQLHIVGAILFEDAVIMAYQYLNPSACSKGSKKLKAEDSSATTLDGTAAEAAGLEVPSQDGLKLRRNADTKELKDYPKSPMSQHEVQPDRTRMTEPSWKVYATYTAGYLWAACFLVWANSKMVYGTSQCQLLDALKSYDLFKDTS